MTSNQKKRRLLPSPAPKAQPRLHGSPSSQPSVNTHPPPPTRPHAPQRHAPHLHAAAPRRHEPPVRPVAQLRQAVQQAGGVVCAALGELRAHRGDVVGHPRRERDALLDVPGGLGWGWGWVGGEGLWGSGMRHDGMGFRGSNGDHNATNAWAMRGQCAPGSDLQPAQRAHRYRQLLGRHRVQLGAADRHPPVGLCWLGGWFILVGWLGWLYWLDWLVGREIGIASSADPPPTP